MPPLLSTMVALALAAGPVGVPEDPTELAREAVAARDAGNLGRALELLERLKVAAPSPRVDNNIARLHELMGHYRAAWTLYRSVADDSSAPPDLRALDAGRAAMLAQRLDRAWLRVTPAGATVYVEGARVTPLPGSPEFGVRPDAAMVLVTTKDGVALVWARPLEAGRRLDVTVPADSTSCGGVWLERAAGPLVVAETIVDPRSARSVCVVGATSATWAEPPTPPVEAPGAPGSPEEPPAPEVLAATMSVGSGDHPVHIPALVTGTSGLAVMLAGGALLLAGELERAAVRDSPRDAAGISLRYTMAQVEVIEERARAQTLAGGVLVGIGTAAAIGGLVWWLVDSDAEDAPIQAGAGPRSVQVSVRF